MNVIAKLEEWEKAPDGTVSAEEVRDVLNHALAVLPDKNKQKFAGFVGFWGEMCKPKCPALAKGVDLFFAEMN